MSAIGLNIETHLPYLLAQASARISLQIDEMASAIGMSRNETKVLITLRGKSGPDAGSTLNELAEVMMVKQPTLSRVVDGMVRAGLLDRKTAAADRRAVTITLTKRGKEQANVLAGHARSMENQMKDLVGHPETEQLIRLLNTVIRRLG